MKMSGPEWRPYSSQDPEITQKAVRIREDTDTDKTMLVARAKDKCGRWCCGDFTVGETHALVCDEWFAYRLENFEVRTTPCLILKKWGTFWIWNCFSVVMIMAMMNFVVALGPDCSWRRLLWMGEPPFKVMNLSNAVYQDCGWFYFV